jgi:hypothetical protein
MLTTVGGGSCLQSQATWEVEIRRIKVQGKPRKKVSKTPLNKWAKGGCVHCNISYVGDIGSKITVQGQLRVRSLRAYLKTAKAKRAGGLAPEHLPTKCRALSSNRSSTKKKY